MHGAAEEGVAQVPQALAPAAPAQRSAHGHAVAQAAQALCQRVRLQRPPRCGRLFAGQRHLAQSAARASIRGHLSAH